MGWVAQNIREHSVLCFLEAEGEGDRLVRSIVRRGSPSLKELTWLRQKAPEVEAMVRAKARKTFRPPPPLKTVVNISVVIFRDRLEPSGDLRVRFYTDQGWSGECVLQNQKLIQVVRDRECHRMEFTGTLIRRSQSKALFGGFLNLVPKGKGNAD